MRPSATRPGEGEAPDFAADGVEAGDGDDVGGVVDDEVAADGGFEGADVAALAADDASLHFVAGDLDDGDGGFGGDFGGNALDGGGDDLAGAFFGFVLGLGFGGADHAVGFVGDFALDLPEQEIACFVGGEGADFFEALAALDLDVGEFGVEVGLAPADLLVAFDEGAVAFAECAVALIRVRGSVLRAAPRGGSGGLGRGWTPLRALRASSSARSRSSRICSWAASCCSRACRSASSMMSSASSRAAVRGSVPPPQRAVGWLPTCSPRRFPRGVDGCSAHSSSRYIDAATVEGHLPPSRAR